MEIKRGDIFYNTTTNTYYVVIGCIYLTEVKYTCMMFTGHETNHTYMHDSLVSASGLTDEDGVFVQVGGIY